MKLGISLLVPSVKELAKENLETIPPRYLRPHEQEFIISQIDNEIPVIDMHNLLSEEANDAELAKLHLACKEWGFFQLVNHGLVSNFLDKVKLETQDFFNLPILAKKKFWQSPEDLEGFGQVFVFSEDQKLDWADVLTMLTHPIHRRKPHLFPKLPLPFRDTLERYTEQVNNIAVTIVGHLANVLECKEMEELLEDGTQVVRMNYYPPCPQPQNVIGITPHSDGSLLTMLLQVNEVDGLQVKKAGMWVPIKPLPNAFIVNVGDALEIITNGIYRSIEHRAMINSEKERLSIAAFCNLRQDGVLGPAASLITEQTPAQFKRIGVREYLRGRVSRKLERKSYLDTLRVEHH